MEQRVPKVSKVLKEFRVLRVLLEARVPRVSRGTKVYRESPDLLDIRDIRG
jgi:hypothetical protein